LLAEVVALVVDGGHDLENAVRRAARSRGINLQQARPLLATVHQAIAEYRTLFRPQQLEQLRKQRELARQAMQAFEVFHPRLAGALVHGDGPLQRIRLLLVAETPEQVAMHLADRHMPWRQSAVELHYSGGRRLMRPALLFVAGDTTVELVILDAGSHSDPPRDPITGGRLATLDAAALDALLEAAPT